MHKQSGDTGSILGTQDTGGRQTKHKNTENYKDEQQVK
jgi:hypothetical protein